MAAKDLSWWVDPDLRARLGTYMNQIVDDYVYQRESSESMSIGRVASQPELDKLEAMAVPSHGPKDIEKVIEDAKEVYKFRMRSEHPRFFGFIPSPVSWVSWLGDTLNTAYNPLPASYLQASGPHAIEDGLIKWLLQQVGFPQNGGGCFLSGGSMANMSAIAIARDQRLQPSFRHLGTVYISDQTHSSIRKAMRILGFEDSQLVQIPTDSDLRMSPDILQQRVEADVAAARQPFLVIATCGTTNAGVIDPIGAIATVCQKHRMWLHVDGAYGASLALSRSYKHLIDEVKFADSLSWDAHKWLFQTYACGMLLVKDRAHLLRTFTTSAEYLEDGRSQHATRPNFWDLGPELTRPARAMKLWFTLQALGKDKIGEMIDHGCHLAESFQRELERNKDWQIVTHARMGIVNFSLNREGCPPEQLDELHRLISIAAIHENLAVPLTTKISGRTILRICALSPDLPMAAVPNIVAGLSRIAQSVTL